MFYALTIMVILALCLGIALGYASTKLKVEGDPLADAVDAILPQIQCGQCGFLGCRPYAEAMAAGEAEINRCVPGGDEVILKLAELLDKEVIPMAIEETTPPPLDGKSRIDESRCIGCTRCMQVCPVDAIVGAAKQMHTVITADCTGCGLCVPTCPVDCIDMVVPIENIDRWKWKAPSVRSPSWMSE